ncbi:MAG: PaaI family thioesterase [Roseomonas sp.]|nr:PaaI family thioesterase [Roseomonas sp.]
MKESAFQDQIPDNHCFGCGPHNANGLRIKSYWDGDEAVSTFTPQPFHMAGPVNVLNGGIIGTVIDCHCICTAFADAYRREGRAIGSAPRLWYATASMKVDYLKPTPIDRPLTLRAKVLESGPKKTRISCSLIADCVESARGEVLAIRVAHDWRD